jgi:hypothetical protein
MIILWEAKHVVQTLKSFQISYSFSAGKGKSDDVNLAVSYINHYSSSIQWRSVGEISEII